MTPIQQNENVIAAQPRWSASANGVGHDALRLGASGPVGLALARDSVQPTVSGVSDARYGPYRIVEFVRSGGMGEIYRAVDERLGRTVALKMLPPRRSSDAFGRRRLFDEARFMSAVRHPNVCTLFDLGQHEGRDFLVLEYLEGSTLEERLSRRPLTTAQALAIARQVARALDAVHRAGMVHGDLKPANIMLADGYDDGPDAKLLDFGLARTAVEAGGEPELAPADCTTRTDPNQIQGTWPYMAPEHFGEGDLDRRADIWSLGVVLYEMVCGRRPFPQHKPAALATAILGLDPTPASQASPTCSPELSALIGRCLAKERSERWASCADLARRLESRALARDPRARARGFVKSVSAAASLLAALVLGPVPSWGGEARSSTAAGVEVVASGESDHSSARDAAAPLDRMQMEQMLLRGRIGKLQRLSVGVSGSSKASVRWQGLTHDAHIQTVDTYLRPSSRHANQSDNYKYNVAAYRLDRLLDLGMVPVSVERAIGRATGAVTWWIDDVEMMELERRKLGREPVDKRRWNEQMQRVFVFQELVSNSDCNQTNVLITRDWTVWMIDFTRAFRSYRKLARPQYLTRIDPGLQSALESLDAKQLRAEMRGLLDSAQIRGILARRDLILAHFAQRPTRGAPVDLESRIGR
jgi:serine/threonine protein kinase